MQVSMKEWSAEKNQSTLVSRREVISILTIYDREREAQTRLLIAEAVANSRVLVRWRRALKALWVRWTYEAPPVPSLGVSAESADPTPDTGPAVEVGVPGKGQEAAE